jgi:malate dehydrogenase
MVARGAMLGPDQPVILHMLDIEPAAQALQGVRMELLDAAYPLLAGARSQRRHGARGPPIVAPIRRERPRSGAAAPAAPRRHAGAPLISPPPRRPTGIVATTNVEEACKDVDFAVMIGGFPRKAGMERKDVMAKNVTIYKNQASALEKLASKDVKVRCGCAPGAAARRRLLVRRRPATALPQVLIVANPANTNAIILKEYAPSIPAKHITCMTRLDHNRALAQVRTPAPHLPARRRRRARRRRPAPAPRPRAPHPRSRTARRSRSAAACTARR